MVTRTPRTPRIAIAGGGTGGHLFPALAAVERIRERSPCARFLFHATPRDAAMAGGPARAAGGAGIDLEVIDAPRIDGRSADRALFPLRFARAVVAALRSHRRFRPDCVIGLGGYGSVPSILAAKLLGRPVVLLEQNAVPGKANRALARLADAVGVAFAEAAAPFGARAELTGNPVRRSLLGRTPDHAAFGLDPARPVLAVVGGSLGARALNRAMAAEAPEIARRGIQVIHTTGAGDAAEVRAAYAAAGVAAFVAPFVADMGAVWATADLALCRAGGTTVAELAATRLPAVLVPLTIHADRHQVRNAESRVIRGGAVLLRECALDPESIRRAVLDRVEDPRALERMSRAYGRDQQRGDDAADRVAGLCLRVASGGRRRPRGEHA